jgi:hypothetical protein
MTAWAAPGLSSREGMPRNPQPGLFVGDVRDFFRKLRN